MNWRSRGAALLREPLFHFLIAGLAIFALFGSTSSPEERRIVIDAARIQRIAGEFEQSFRRVPAPSELDELIREDVKNEVYYREALRLGLDRDDIVVKRRMRAKMQSFETSADDFAPPDDATLQKWIDAHPDRFAGQARYSFEQRYLGADPAAAAAGLDALRQGRAFAGTPAPLPQAFVDTDAFEVATQFGDGFPKALDRLALEQWTGPVESGIGHHLVRVTARQAAAPPKLAEIRQRVENDWRSDQARKASAAAYAKLLAGYEVVIEEPR